MDLDSMVLDTEFFRHADMLFCTETINYSSRFEVFSRRSDISRVGDNSVFKVSPIDRNLSTRLTVSNELKRISAKRPKDEVPKEGIYSSVDHEGQKSVKAELEIFGTRRDLLKRILRLQAADGMRYDLHLSEPYSPIETLVDIPKEGAVINGRGPANPIYSRLKSEGYTRKNEVCSEQHPTFSVFGHLLVDGRNTSSNDLNLYRAGDNLVVASNSGGFFPEMWYANEINEALNIILPGRQKNAERLSNPQIEKHENKTYLSRYTNARPKQLLAAKIFVGDTEVRLIPTGDYLWDILVGNDSIARISMGYNFSEYPDPTDTKTWKTEEGLTPTEIRDKGYSCCMDSMKFYGLVNRTDQEWANTLAEYFIKTMPGMSVEQQGNEVHLRFDAFGIDNTIERRMAGQEVKYLVNGKPKEVGYYETGKILGFAFNKK